VTARGAGGDDCLFNVWRRIPKAELQRHRPRGTVGKLLWRGHLQGHRAAPTCVDVSRDLGVIVTGDAASVVHTWDLNTLECARRHRVSRGPVVAVCISQATGDVAAAASHSLHLWDLNGAELVSLDLSGTLSITAMALASTSGAGTLRQCALLATGHRDGSVRLWAAQLKPLARPSSDALPELGRWQLVLLVTVRNGSAPVLSVAFGRALSTLWTGDSAGVVSRWAVPAAARPEPKCACRSKSFPAVCSFCELVVCGACLLDHTREAHAPVDLD
jgi:WD40 repeat protein